MRQSSAVCYVHSVSWREGSSSFDWYPLLRLDLFCGKYTVLYWEVWMQKVNDLSVFYNVILATENIFSALCRGARRLPRVLEVAGLNPTRSGRDSPPPPFLLFLWIPQEVNSPDPQMIGPNVRVHCRARLRSPGSWKHRERVGQSPGLWAEFWEKKKIYRGDWRRYLECLLLTATSVLRSSRCEASPKEQTKPHSH